MLKPLIFVALLSLFSTNLIAQTTRISQFENEKVKVWQTVIYPNKQETLPMHRHEHNRVVVALTDGVLKVTNQKGQFYDLVLEKDKAYYLPADKAGEMHNDENMSGKPIKVMVIELN